MKVQVAKWGNSAGVRLPKTVLESLRIAPGAELEMWVRGGELHLRPVRPVTSYRLEDLLEQITPDSVPGFEDWPAVGREIIDDDYSR